MSDLNGKTIVVTGAGQDPYEGSESKFVDYGMTNICEKFKKYLPCQNCYSQDENVYFGIGRDLCERLDALGAIVYAISRSAEPLNDLKAKCPKVNAIQLDLSDWGKTKTGLQNSFKNIKIDGLVNNAGIAICKPIEEHSEKDFDDTINVNLKAIFNVTQTLLPNIKDGGSIVNLSSLAGLRAFANHSIYSASKGGVDALTRAFALELGPRKIRVNSVNPTVVLTAMSIPNWSDPVKAESVKNHIPLHRFAEVNEVSEPIIYLLSEKSSFINAHSVPIEGGFCAL